MNVLKFAKTIGNLKKMKRTGWVEFAEVKEPESIADHIMRVTALALVSAKELGVDTNKLVKMAVVHDLAESVVGDLIGERGDDEKEIKESKLQRERTTVNELFNGMRGSEELVKLYEEYEKQETKEAKILKQLDKFEMALQALEYEDKTESNKLDEFWVNADKYIKDPIIRSWFEKISKERKEKNNGK
jgi:putative hydrolase of HD superfamily